jgi:hypothetical protein
LAPAALTSVKALADPAITGEEAKMAATAAIERNKRMRAI